MFTIWFKNKSYDYFQNNFRGLGNINLSHKKEEFYLKEYVCLKIIYLFI